MLILDRRRDNAQSRFGPMVAKGRIPFYVVEKNSFLKYIVNKFPFETKGRHSFIMGLKMSTITLQSYRKFIETMSDNKMIILLTKWSMYWNFSFGCVFT
jgi:hypothetical protein